MGRDKTLLMYLTDPTKCSNVNCTFWTNHRLANLNSRYFLCYKSGKPPRKLWGTFETFWEMLPRIREVCPKTASKNLSGQRSFRDFWEVHARSLLPNSNFSHLEANLQKQTKQAKRKRASSNKHVPNNSEPVYVWNSRNFANCTK